MPVHRPRRKVDGFATTRGTASELVARPGQPDDASVRVEPPAPTSAAPSLVPTRLGVAARWLSAIAAVLVLAAGIATAIYTIASVYRLHVVLPVWDEWVTIEDLHQLRIGSFGLADLARQYNEHRLFVPRLFFFVDDLVFGMSGRFNLAVMFTFQAINAAILIGLTMRVAVARASKVLLAGFVLLLLFSLRQEQNFTFGFQLQFTGVFTFAMLAALVFVESLDRFGTFGAPPRQGAWPRLALAGLLGTASGYTMANGVLVLPTLFVLALLVRAPVRVSLLTASAAAVLAVVYFHNLRRGPPGLTLDNPLADALAYPRFLAALMGNMIGDDVATTEILGVVGLAGAAAAALRVAIRRTRDRASAVLLAIMGFMIASACAITYGRSGVLILQAFEGRYVEPTALFWCALVLFWARALAETSSAIMRIGIAAGLAAAMPVLGLAAGAAELRAWPGMVAQAATFAAFRDGLLTGLFDKDAARYEVFSQEDLAPRLAFIRAEHLSLFGTREAAEVGRPIEDVGAVAPGGTCSGTVAAHADVEALGTGGARLSGTAWDAAGKRPVRRILVTGADRRVQGFGSLETPSGRSRRWNGVAKAQPGERLAAYAVLSDGSLCDLGGADVR